ncbi:unnamed protein product [Amoebophrya sp. A25]|nr:unnamed protein product [Amoebophrya sp. A25]|eukprot:GSA25T00016179001.1
MDAERQFLYFHDIQHHASENASREEARDFQCPQTSRTGTHGFGCHVLRNLLVILVCELCPALCVVCGCAL